MSHSTTAKREIYCMKCRAKTESSHIQPATLKNGKSALSGKCSACGTKTFTIVKQGTK